MYIEEPTNQNHVDSFGEAEYISTRPLSCNSSDEIQGDTIQEGAPTSLKYWESKCLCKDVRNLPLSWYGHHVNHLSLIQFTDEVLFQLEMFVVSTNLSTRCH